ncbi:hypothetical protein EK21DRAFT_91517 [Setomelanomma holmii]|uniref:Uncharacterized protein n=1 Tax=Setomelanomma holmii TaxID=210430 RepID=A0A9P4H3R6_9PLEO|nr:hypothetical protein EK21DRAFT_91517 [Setomelanomma holmii]
MPLYRATLCEIDVSVVARVLARSSSSMTSIFLVRLENGIESSLPMSPSQYALLVTGQNRVRQVLPLAVFVKGGGEETDRDPDPLAKVAWNFFIPGTAPFRRKFSECAMLRVFDVDFMPAMRDIETSRIPRPRFLYTKPRDKWQRFASMSPLAEKLWNILPEADIAPGFNAHPLCILQLDDFSIRRPSMAPGEPMTAGGLFDWPLEASVDESNQDEGSNDLADTLAARQSLVDEHPSNLFHLMCTEPLLEGSAFCATQHHIVVQGWKEFLYVADIKEQNSSIKTLTQQDVTCHRPTPQQMLQFQTLAYIVETYII